MTRPELFRRAHRNGGPRYRGFEPESLVLGWEPVLHQRLQRAACMAEIRGWDVVLDNLFVGLLEVPEAQRSEACIWVDPDGTRHVQVSGDPDRVRLRQIEQDETA